MFISLLSNDTEGASAWTFTAVAQPSWPTEDITGQAKPIGWSTTISQGELDAFPTSVRQPGESKTQKAFRLAELRYTAYRAGQIGAQDAALYYLASGAAAVPASLIGGGTVNVTVTISPAMPDADYKASAILTGSSTILGSLVVQGIVIKTPTTVQVSIKNNALISLSGGIVEVTAVKVVA